MLTSCFRVLLIMGFTVENRHLINVYESATVMELQVGTRCFWSMDKQFNINEIKLLNKKLSLSSRSTDSGQVVIHAVMQCAYACQHQQS